jgi:hypothetical protein
MLGIAAGVLFLLVVLLVIVHPDRLLRAGVRLYSKEHPRREELLADLDREQEERAYLDPQWVLEQLELVLREGFPERVASVRKIRRRRRTDRKEIADHQERITAETLGWAQAIVRERAILFRK